MIYINTSRLNTTDYHTLMYEILESYFSILLVKEKELLHSLMVLFSQHEPISIKTATFEMISHVQSEIAVSADFVQVMDYFVDCHIKDTHIGVQLECYPIDFFDYHLLQQKLKKKDAIEYPLISLMWQIYDNILPTELSTHDTRWLRFKIIGMPDFNTIGSVPQYIPSVIRHCMQEGKTMSELHTDFPNVTVANLNRLLLMCVLIGVVDLGILYSSHEHNQKLLSQVEFFGKKSQDGSLNHTADSSHTNQKDLKPPRKAGFFSRFLYK